MCAHRQRVSCIQYGDIPTRDSSHMGRPQTGPGGTLGRAGMGWIAYEYIPHWILQDVLSHVWIYIYIYIFNTYTYIYIYVLSIFLYIYIHIYIQYCWQRGIMFFNSYSLLARHAKAKAKATLMLWILHVISKTTRYVLRIDCWLIAYWLPLMHICSAIMDMGPGRGPRAQKLPIVAEHMCIKGNL